MRRHSIALQFAYLLAGGVSSIGHAAETQEVACPLRMPAGALQSGKNPTGWKMVLKPGMPLSDAGMLHGPYDGSGYLVPSSSKVRKNGREQTFTQTWAFGAPPHYEKWLYCEYGGSLEMYRRIADDVVECTMVSTVVQDAAIDAIKFSCAKAHR